MARLNFGIAVVARSIWCFRWSEVPSVQQDAIEKTEATNKADVEFTQIILG
jgi:hypothetical protein